MLLSIREAAEYSNIGINKIDEMLKQPNCPFVLYVGTKKLVKRKAFEEFIEGRVAIWWTEQAKLVRTKNIEIYWKKSTFMIEWSVVMNSRFRHSGKEFIKWAKT